MSHQVVNEEIRKSLLILLRPLVQINFILGTCPCLISPEGQIKTPFKYFNFARFFFIVGLLIFLSVSLVVKGFVALVTSTSWDNEFLHKHYFEEMKNKVVGLTLSKYVDIACGFYANLIPAVFLCLAIFKRKQILNFLNVTTTNASGITGFGDHVHSKRVITRLFIMHGIFAFVTSILMVMRFISHYKSKHGPGTITLWFMNEDDLSENGEWILWVMAPFFGFISLAKTAVTAFIETCCVSMASCFCKMVENIQRYLGDVMEHWNMRFLDEAHLTRILTPRAVDGYKTEGGTTCKIHKNFENYLEQIKNQATLQLSDVHDYQKRPIHIRGDYCDFHETTPGQQILFVIDKFQIVRNMQTAANGLFGGVLALHTGFTVFMCVVLKYMLIWNFGTLIKLTSENKSNGNQTHFAGDYGKGDIIWNATEANTFDGNDPFLNRTFVEWMMFALMDTCFSIRLFVLVIFLGNVHYTSLKFNSKLSQALLQAQKIADVIELQGMSNKFFKGRQVMTQSEANTVLGFITENSANPMAFSAAGLFCFSRNLILVILSIIITYLVFLLQV